MLTILVTVASLYLTPKDTPETRTEPVPAELKVSALTCYKSCNSKDQSGCWMPGAMYAWNHDCVEKKDRPFR